MAISITSSAILLISVVLTMATTPSYADKKKITDGDINHMCFKTGRRIQCEKLMKSVLHATDRDAKELAQAAVYYASQRALRLCGLFQTKDKEAHDEKLKKIFESCGKAYDDVVKGTRSVYNALHSFAHGVSDAALKKAYQEAKNCQKMVHDGGVDGAELKKGSQEVELAISVAKVAVDHLNKKVV